MQNRYFELRDARRESVRTACQAIDDVLLRMPAADADELRARWAELVEALALEPARALRECPVCNQVAMLEATRCFHCWAKLTVA